MKVNILNAQIMETWGDGKGDRDFQKDYEKILDRREERTLCIYVSFTIIFWIN